MVNVDTFESIWVGWLTPYLFKHRTLLNEHFDSLNFVIGSLLTVRNQDPIEYDLKMLQNKFGTHWWNKITHYKKNSEEKI